MRKTLQLLFVAIMISTPTMAQKITIEYAQDFDFASVETYQYVDTTESNAPDQLIHDRIRYAIIRELAEAGLRSVSSDPDLYVTYHLTSNENTVYDTTSFGYGGSHGGWGAWGGGVASSTTTASTYAEGTLIVDAYEPIDKKMVWHGTGTVTVKSKPEKQTKQITKILAKLGKKWDQILAGEGK